MAAGYQDLFIEQGTTFNTEITLDDVTGTAMNLTNFTVSSQARKSYYSSSATIVFDATISDPNNGVITLAANSAVTSNVSPGKFVYDVLITDTVFNNVTRVLEGQIFVSPSVTR
jgi:hypothetical protein